MARVTGALFSASASGNLKKTIVYSRCKGVQTVKGNRLEKVGAYHFKSKPVVSQSLGQLSVRETFKNATIAWNESTQAEQDIYYEKAKGKSTTAVALFIQEYIKSQYDFDYYNLAFVFGIGFGIILPFLEKDFLTGAMLSIGNNN